MRKGVREFRAVAAKEQRCDYKAETAKRMDEVYGDAGTMLTLLLLSC